MSGRPYARNPRAPFAGPRDLEAVLPHTFRLAAPMRVRNAKHEAIRRAIRRRCMQKNWRKMISIRHTRIADEIAAENAAEEAKSEEKGVQDENETEAQLDAAAVAKKQLEELEQKLQGLTDQKHAKFQLLKDILVEEARSKMSLAPTPTAVAKKRRVEFKDPNRTLSPAKMQSPPPSSEAANAASPGTSKE